MNALALPLGLKLAQHSRQALIAGNGPVMPGRPWLAGLQPFLCPLRQHQVCRLQHHQVPSVSLANCQPRAEHGEQACPGRLKQLRRIAFYERPMMDLLRQRIQQIGQRPVSTRGHCSPNLLPLTVRRRLIRQEQVLNHRALSKNASLSLGAKPQLRMRRIRVLTHASQCSARQSSPFQRS